MQSPAELVVATEAVADGSVTRRELRRAFTKMHRNVYVRTDCVLTASDRARAAWLWSGRDAALVGLSAAALLGSKWVPADAPAEIGRARRPGAPGIVVHSGEISDDELCEVEGLECTTVERTAYDLGRRLALTLAVIRIDALLNARPVPIAHIQALADRYPGARHIRRLRSALALVDGGAESPQESRTRLLLMQAGLPPPVTQIEVRDDWGRVSARIDMGWPEWKVGVEYDGAQHWTDARQHARDIERLEFLAALGWRIVRVSASQLRSNPAGIVARVMQALRRAGCPR